MRNDQRFVYYLLAAKGVCVVPISSFASDLEGFRVTLLEENPELMKETFHRIKEGIIEYCES
jgi:alanine-synthesizing transaminase